MTTKEIALTICEKMQNEYPKRPIWQTMLEIEDLINKHVEKQLSMHGVVFNEAKTIDKQTQKKHIEDIMQSDEELGLYSEQLFCDCGKNKPIIKEPAYIHCTWCDKTYSETK
ncbi:hypothetical protein Phi4:1_gp188 [Cellulophaga phage phi4:1]|uniref:Uncharacterized protein n=5 Tax=Lightbulbvirus TaxID=1918522 RepID=A0A0S2MWW6_9CAUD|nr:hypothetical protein Phi4:1_gp188 [Cellulophaga phage phi4:1]YP_008241684.1 hypothetical protein Phi17:2_gp189 [Cellulophaga phage phi17:2]ALO80197.1 hypothetical protein Phi4113_188 [Cellulophaga phage phi4:1_13]ALO80394.1 hypothetical protein Phi4118_188 [Cellulophaga phage phi4:1_18]ALO80592.1 hypothetical protein Phi17218_189 [Cellulophaga phage phi17:2_18]AGO47722.1 hypothetical protein Phi17:2_gp189 [Cellulophaga phage phi17:2]AGO49601.1 hypothetical protein Phi4:1_gp188 [Cellulophag